MRSDPSSYYHFDDEAREVVFHRHDTPSPWINYLSNGTFHAFLSQAGGGLAWHRSPQIWRINRYRFFHLPTDRSGFYLYLRDRETGIYWSPTHEPCRERPDRWESAHGLGYTRFRAGKDGLSAELTYFVGPLENNLIWRLKLANESSRERRLDLFAYVEFGLMEFLRELQWQCYNKHQVSVDYLADAGAIVYRYGVEMQPKPEETPLVYLAADRPPDAYDGDRDEFIGSYRSEADPAAVAAGACTNSTLQGGDPCGALQFSLDLAPAASREIAVFLGTAMQRAEIGRILARVRVPGFVDESYARLRQGWADQLRTFACSIPDPEARRMINIWNPYQAQRNFLFSRNISYYATGTFRGVGYRDTAQDILARIPFDIEAAKDKIRLLLKEQYRDGHVNHYFFPVEGWPPVTSVHADDHLWPVLAVWDAVMETGDLAFLKEKIPYYDGGEATVYEHLCQAVAFTEYNLGANGFPLMLRSDWNDALFRVCRAGKGESIWEAMHLGTVLTKLAELARLLGKEQDALSFEELYERQKKLVNGIGWDGRWFRRAVMDDGGFLGSDEHEEAKIWINAQTWSVISGMAEGDKGRIAMDSVRELLDTDLGLRKVYPAIRMFPDPKDPLTNYNPGTGENGTIFCHANTWAVIAECMLGRGDIAYKYYRQLIPHVAMQKAGIWRYKAEPYVYASNLFGPESDKFGLANVSWLTGTAAWMYIAATQYILGIRPQWRGLMIDPCLPSSWKDVRIERDFRGCRHEIRICNESGSGRGIKHMEVGGTVAKGNIITPMEGGKVAVVKVIL